MLGRMVVASGCILGAVKIFERLEKRGTVVDEADVENVNVARLEKGTREECSVLAVSNPAETPVANASSEVIFRVSKCLLCQRDGRRDLFQLTSVCC